MDTAFIGKPYHKTIPLIKNILLIAGDIYTKMIKNKNF